MTAVSDSSGTSSAFSDTYQYNGLDQRVGKTETAGTHHFTRADDAIDSSVLSDGNAVYNYGANENALVSEVRGSGASAASSFYHADALGSNVVMDGGTGKFNPTDAFGNSISTYHTETEIGDTPSPTTPFGFVGQGGYQTDTDTGLMLCGHRFYDSCTGRFLSRDPAQAGYNWYTYCENDPVNNTDVTGLASIPEMKKVQRLLDDMGFVHVGYSSGHPEYKDPNGERVLTPGDHGKPNVRAWRDKLKELEKMKKDRDAAEEAEQNAQAVGVGLGAGAVVGGGYILWEGVKWGVAILAAPETGGLSLGVAAAIP